MDYHCKFEFDKEMKENLNTINIPEQTIEAYVERKDENIMKMPMVETSFSQLNELAGNLGKHKHSMNHANSIGGMNARPKDKLIKCYYAQNIELSTLMSNQGSQNGSYLSMYTPGGFRYFASIKLPILKVFPLEDGVLVKCVYDQKLLKVDFSKQIDRISYAYITLTKHPLEDLRPLALMNTKLKISPLVDTQYDILYVSDSVPICIIFDDLKNELVFALLRSNEEDINSEDYIKGLDYNTSRDQTIKHISKTPEILVSFIDSEIIESGVKPNQFEIVDSFEENEFVIVIHFTLLCQTRFYKCALDSENSTFAVTCVQILDNIRCIYSFEFLSQNDLQGSKICPFTNSRKLYNQESEYLRSKIRSYFSKEIITLCDDGSLSIYKGYLPLLTLNAAHDLPILVSELDIARITNLSNPKNSRITFHLSNGGVTRYDFQFKTILRDQILQQCLEITRKILPVEVYYKFYQHFVMIICMSGFTSTVKSENKPSAWLIFTELFFSIIDKNLSEPRIPTQTIDLQEDLVSNEFDKMLGSRSCKKLSRKFKLPWVTPDQTIQSPTTNTFDRRVLMLKRLRNFITDDDLACFQRCSEDLFNVFHLMQEDMRLNIFELHCIQDGRLNEFLFRFCLKKGPKKFCYSEYYAREDPILLAKYQKEYAKFKIEYMQQVYEAREQMLENMSNSNFLIPSILSQQLVKVPSIYAWIEAKLDPNQSTYDSEYFCFFEATRKVWRIYEIFASEGKEDYIYSSKIHPLLTKSKYDMDPSDLNDDPSSAYSLFSQSDFSYEDRYCINPQKYYMLNTNLNLFEKIVFCLKEECMGRSSIKKLPLGISLPIHEVLTHDYFKTIYVKSSDEQRKQIKEWPKEVFKLIEREDLYYNLQELKSKEIASVAVQEFQFSRVSTLNLEKKFTKRKSMLKLGRTDSNIFNNPQRSIPVKSNAKNSKQKTEYLVEEESEEQKYMELIDKEFKSLGFKNKKEAHIFNTDLRYQEVCSILDSSIPFKLRVDKIEGFSQMTNDEFTLAK